MRVISLAAAALLAWAPARAETPVKFALDWFVIGYDAPFTDALAKHYYEQNGLKVSIDRGYGSGDTIAKVGNGVYDFGYADPNLLLKWNHDNPDAKVTMVYLVWDGTQSAVMSMKSAGITKPEDLIGKKIGAPPSDNTRMMFPLFAKATGIDMSKIDFIAAQPNMTNTMLFEKQVDALTSLEGTTFLALRKFGVPPEDIVAIRYSKYLPDLLGVGILVSEKTLATKPELVKAFVKSVVQGEEDTIAHPKEAISTLTLLDPLADLPNELIRLNITFETAMQNPYVKAHGLGAVDPKRLQTALHYAADTFDVPVPSNTADIYDTRFLPPDSERPFAGYTPPP
jgi:NitT/TauT family transport system substrate-binding protein